MTDGDNAVPCFVRRMHAINFARRSSPTTRQNFPGEVEVSGPVPCLQGLGPLSTCRRPAHSRSLHAAVDESLARGRGDARSDGKPAVRKLVSPHPPLFIADLLQHAHGFLPRRISQSAHMGEGQDHPFDSLRPGRKSRFPLPKPFDRLAGAGRDYSLLLADASEVDRRRLRTASCAPKEAASQWPGSGFKQIPAPPGSPGRGIFAAGRLEMALGLRIIAGAGRDAQLASSTLPGTQMPTQAASPVPRIEAKD